MVYNCARWNDHLSTSKIFYSPTVNKSTSIKTFFFNGENSLCVRSIYFNAIPICSSKSLRVAECEGLQQKPKKNKRARIEQARATRLKVQKFVKTNDESWELIYWVDVMWKNTNGVAKVVYLFRVTPCWESARSGWFFGSATRRPVEALAAGNQIAESSTSRTWHQEQLQEQVEGKMKHIEGIRIEAKSECHPSRGMPRTK